MSVAMLIEPYGGKLVDLSISDPEERAELQARAASLATIQLSLRSVCDLELLATGALSPLRTFMGEADYRSVLRDGSLANGLLFPMPITLPLPDAVRPRHGETLALQGRYGELLALLTVDELFEWNRTFEATQVCGTLDQRHPLVAEMATWPERYISGSLRVLRLPCRYGFDDLRRTPAQVRAALASLGRPTVVAFHTRNPMHRAHEELTKRAACSVGGTLLIHPAVGPTRPGDVEPYTRVRCYRELVAHYFDPARTLLGVVPLAMRMAGPREALWHAIVRRNFGATHLIVGRDHAGPGLDSNGRPFYRPTESQEAVRRHEDQVGVKALTFDELVYLPEEDRYVERTSASGKRVFAVSGTAIRERYLATGIPLPPWLTRPEVAAILTEAASPNQAGFCVWFTGLSGAGKSTIAGALAERLTSEGRAVTVLDGDVVRREMSPDLGFTRADRDTNVLRIGRKGAELARQGGAVLCAVISPYDATRAQVRSLFGNDRFVLVHVDAPLELCEERDVKGMYARARLGGIKAFTGIDDPYELPADADIRLDTAHCGIEESVRHILRYLAARGLACGPADNGTRQPQAATEVESL